VDGSRTSLSFTPPHPALHCTALHCLLPAQVVAVQAQQETVITCNADAAVNLLWSVAVSGSLSLDLWDALAVALDQPGAALQSQQLQQVFEAYCLVVLRIGGPAPRPPPAGQLAAAAEAYWNAVVAPAGADRAQLLEVLSASGVVPRGRPLTSLQDGHLLLFDMLVPGGGGGRSCRGCCSFAPGAVCLWPGQRRIM